MNRSEPGAADSAPAAARTPAPKKASPVKGRDDPSDSPERPVKLPALGPGLFDSESLRAHFFRVKYKPDGISSD